MSFLKPKLNDMDITSKDISLVLNEWNLKRIALLCMFILLMQAANLLDSGVISTPYLLRGVHLLIMLSSVYLLFYRILLKWAAQSKKRTSVIVLVFWLSYILFNMPFCARDAEQMRTPLAYFIVIVLLTIIPIVSSKMSVVLFSTAIVSGGVSSYLFGPLNMYYLYMFIFSVGGIVFSNVISRNYVALLEKLVLFSTHDALTSLYNRFTGIQRGAAMYEMCRRNRKFFCVMMCDIDHFKRINDCYGHQKGDEILILVASIFQSVFKRKDDVACRFGGEEFTVFCALDTDGADQLAEKLLAEIRSIPLQIKGKDQPEQVTISIGYFCMKPTRMDNLDIDSMIGQADRALYQAKVAGRDCAIRYAGE